MANLTSLLMYELEAIVVFEVVLLSAASEEGIKAVAQRQLYDSVIPDHGFNLPVNSSDPRMTVLLPMLRPAMCVLVCQSSVDLCKKSDSCKGLLEGVTELWQKAGKDERR